MYRGGARVRAGLGGRGLVMQHLPFSPQGPKDAASQPSMATQPDQLSSPYTPLLQDSLSGQPTNPKV